MDDRPGREQEDGRLAGAVHLVVQPHTVALDVAGAVGVPGPRLLAGGPGHLAPDHGRASKTRLNGVCAARRKRVKPAAVTTSLILASPAWAPSASPTSCDSEAGVHSSVENE